MGKVVQWRHYRVPGVYCSGAAGTDCSEPGGRRGI